MIGQNRQILESNLGLRGFLFRPQNHLVLQVQSARSKIDNPVMAAQDLSPEKTGHRLGTTKQIAVDKPFQIDDANIFADDIDRAYRYMSDPGDGDAPLL